MFSNFSKIFLILLSINLTYCENPHISSTKSSLIEVKGPDDPILSEYISVYRDSIKLGLDDVIGFSDNTYTKNDFNNINFNSSLGNLIADIIFIQSDSIFKLRENRNIDFVLQNHGGLRASLLKGEIKLSDAYKILPFDNEIVVVEVLGETVFEIISFLKNEINPHPISGITINETGSLIRGSFIDPEKKYTIATNDYLLNGGDQMFFFSNNLGVYNLGYYLRDAFVDFTKTNLELTSKIDNRFLKNE